MPSDSAEAELEALIWAAMRAHKVSTDHAVPFVDAIKHAAWRYAAGDSDALTAMRREVLHRDTAPQAQTSPSDCGRASRADATELDPTGSVAEVRRVAGGGATMSTDQSIPGALTCVNGELSTMGTSVIHRLPLVNGVLRKRRDAARKAGSVTHA